MFRSGLVVVYLISHMLHAQAADGELREAPLAKAFGSQPEIFAVDLSPSGTKISFLQMHPAGTTIAAVSDLAQRKTSVVLAGKPNEFDVAWCDWANDERLLCSLRFTEATPNGMYFPVTRLVGVNADGSAMKTLLSQQMQDIVSQYQDRIVDWLVDDPDHVLVELRIEDETALGTLDINTGIAQRRVSVEDKVYGWISDGHGEPRMYQRIDEKTRAWYYLNLDPRRWEILKETSLTDPVDSFAPLGFGEDRNELLYLDLHGDRMALYAMKLDAGRATRLVYENDHADVAGIERIGKYRRVIAAGYIDDRPHRHYFDNRIAALHAELQQRFPQHDVVIDDEDWAQRFYLVFVSSDTDPGTYYRYDTDSRKLERIASTNSKLKGITLAPMRQVSYPARDGVAIPAYLTLPANRPAEKLAAVVLPHGGPSSRDYRSFNFLVQFLAASGYAVLQSNYRGSSGYGRSWEGAGGFRNWRVAVGDITDGVKYLVDQGIADPARICIVGWSYGGYAALMSSIEHAANYRCAASIAGVTNPEVLGNLMRENVVGGKGAQAFIGDSDDVLKQGSPERRAAEIKLPLFMAHARKDTSVPYQQGHDLAEALRKAQRPAEFITYEDAGHDIRPERYRIDLLARLGEFLRQHIGQ